MNDNTKMNMKSYKALLPRHKSSNASVSIIIEAPGLKNKAVYAFYLYWYKLCQQKVPPQLKSI